VAGCLDHVIMYIDDCHVYLLDGSENGQHREIIRLARSSSAQHLRADPDEPTNT